MPFFEIKGDYKIFQNGVEVPLSTEFKNNGIETLDFIPSPHVMKPAPNNKHLPLRLFPVKESISLCYLVLPHLWESDEDSTLVIHYMDGEKRHLLEIDRNDFQLHA